MSTSRTRLPTTLLVVSAIVLLLWPQSAITRDNAAQIRPGMTVSEVEEILGGPARDEAPEWAPMRQMFQSVRPDLEWSSDQVSVRVYLEADGRVKESRAIPAPPGSRDIVARLRRWLRL